MENFVPVFRPKFSDTVVKCRYCGQESGCLTIDHGYKCVYAKQTVPEKNICGLFVRQENIHQLWKKLNPGKY